MKIFTFFSYKLNRRILFAFLFIILIPGIVSFWVTSFMMQKTLHREIESRLREASTVYFKEMDTIEQKCMNIVTVYSHKKTIVEQILNRKYSNLEEDMIEFHKMKLIDIIEIEDANGKVIFRGHNPDFAGDLKIDQNVVKEGLAGKINVSYEHGHSGFAIRAVAPVFYGEKVIGLFMAGSLFSGKFVDRMKSLTLLDNGIYRGNQKIISTYKGMTFLSPADMEKLKTGTSIVKFSTLLDKKLFHIMIKPLFLKNTYWGAVVLGLNKQESEKTYHYANTQLTYVVLFGLFLAVLIYYFLARNINKSISRIITGISNVSFDHPNKPIKTSRGDEFGIIADNYNMLLERLELYNQRIHQLQNDLVESTRLATAGQVAASLAHEIRNPLSSIKMMSQIIKSRYLTNKKGSEEIHIILEEIERINRKVSELLEFARPEKLDFVICNIHQILDGVVNLCLYTIKEQNITLVKEYDENIPDLFADGEKLRICFLNIILNALQVMKNGSILKISTNLAKGVLSISICNSGSSIELEDTEKLFVPFYSTREGGTGLGLAISKIIIERHQGTLSVTKEEQMVCFNISIPMVNQR